MRELLVLPAETDGCLPACLDGDLQASVGWRCPRARTEDGGVIGIACGNADAIGRAIQTAKGKFSLRVSRDGDGHKAVRTGQAGAWSQLQEDGHAREIRFADLLYAVGLRRIVPDVARNDGVGNGVLHVGGGESLPFCHDDVERIGRPVWSLKVETVRAVEVPSEQVATAVIRFCAREARAAQPAVSLLQPDFAVCHQLVVEVIFKVAVQVLIDEARNRGHGWRSDDEFEPQRRVLFTHAESAPVRRLEFPVTFVRARVDGRSHVQTQVNGLTWSGYERQSQTVIRREQGPVCEDEAVTIIPGTRTRIFDAPCFDKGDLWREDASVGDGNIRYKFGGVDARSRSRR